MSDRIDVCAQSVQQFLRRPDHWRGPYDIVFADPPYELTAELESVFAESATDGLFALDAWLVVEHASKTHVPSRLGLSTFLRKYRYGDTALSLFSSSTPAQS
jgi:16S rRNA G966 N2-methylase RsmD